jgi:hypothetical protein
MVDALSRACRWVAPPHGRVIDVRPTDIHPDVELGLPNGSVLRAGGLIVDDERGKRHAAADSALRLAIARGLVRVQDEQAFAFYRYADTAEELRDHIATKWRQTRMDDATCARVHTMLAQHTGSRLWLREPAGIRVLIPLRPGS